MPATMIIKANNTFTVDITVSDGNQYDDSVQLKFARNFGAGKVHGTDELFLTPIQMELLGKFLIRQADEIRTAQSFREVA